METVNPEQAEQPKKLGKFDTAEELLSAYNALESEFTKRCQLLKQLQAELIESRAQEQRLPPETAENDGARPSPVPTEPEMSDGGNGADGVVVTAATYEVPSVILDNLEEYAEILSGIPEIMNACIERYKRKLIGERGVLSASPRGMAVIVPAARPKTLSEAKRIAEQLL